MNDQVLSGFEVAERDFQRARQEAMMRQILARLRGKSDKLLCYDDVRRQLRAESSVELGLREIPLEKIVGSVGRYQDFTRSFLPIRESNKERWARVKAAIVDMKGMPPISVYQLGDAYFVIDGNHRVSVARQLDTDTIAAYVTEVKTRVPLTADDDPKEVICKARYADFLAQTNLDQLRPDTDLLLTFCSEYGVLLDQIKSECRLQGADQQVCDVTDWPQAVMAWYDHVYLPVIQIVREMGVRRNFPDRTEADIYVLLSERREALEEALGWRLDLETTVTELVQQPKGVPIFDKALSAVAPGLNQEPETGYWRKKQYALHREFHLFKKILVVLEGIEGDQALLDQILSLSKKDHDHILGLYATVGGKQPDPANVARVQTQFATQCQKAGLPYEFAAAGGARFADIVVERAAWVDLVVINLTHPPSPHPIDRLRSSWASIIQRCPRPILAVPDAVYSTHDRILLSYDGSPKAEEALFVAAYLTARWHRKLTVLTVETTHTQASAIDQARNYLQQNGITWANYVVRTGSIHDAIQNTAAAYNSNMLIMGGFGRQPALRLVLGSTVEHALREFKQPMLICR